MMKMRLSNLRLSKQWLLTLFVVLLLSGLISGCTRDRAVETEPAAIDGAPTVDTNIVDEPEVVVLPTVAATEAPAPEPTPSPTVMVDTMPYTVQPGDTVSTIAEKFGITSQQLRQMNLINTDALLVGQVLRVPNTGAIATDDNAAAPVATAGPFTYVVKENDSLLSIAIQFGVSTNEIVAANTLADPNSVFVGQELLIPGYQPEVPPTPVPAEPFEYVIQAGDTLFSIAQEFDVSAQEIVDANSIPDPNNLIQGRVLVIPGYTAASAPNTLVDGTPNQRTNDVSAAIHTVRAGETLLAIAQLYGVTAAEIASANGLSNPNQIQPGQQLTIPGVTAEEVRAANQVVHTVARGDTLFSIAQRYNVTADAILEANDLTNPNFITVGQDLIIPSEE